MQINSVWQENLNATTSPEEEGLSQRFVPGTVIWLKDCDSQHESDAKLLSGWDLVSTKDKNVFNVIHIYAFCFNPCLKPILVGLNEFVFDLTMG